MGFKIFGKKNGKRIVSDKPENGDMKVTEATKILPNGDPEAVKKGTIIRVIWIPEAANTYCWIQGVVSKTSVSEEKSKKGTFKTNKVTIEDLVLVECFGEEYSDELPQKIKVVLNPKETWAMGPEATLSTEEENEVVQIDIDSIPRVIPWDSDDVVDEAEVKGAAGGMPVVQQNNNSVKITSLEDLFGSDDESSDDEAVRIVKEEKEARKLREEYKREDVFGEDVDDIIHRVKKAAQTNQIDSSTPKHVHDACKSALQGMDQAFIAGILRSSGGEERDDSKNYSRNKSYKMKLEATAKAKAFFDGAKRKMKIVEEEEYEKLRLLLASDEHALSLTKDLFTRMKAVWTYTKKNAKTALQSSESLGAISRSQSKTRQSNLKVKLADNTAKDITVPTAPSQEDMVDVNDRPPKYESINRRTEPPLGIMQTPGSLSYNFPGQQLSGLGWQQQAGAYQYPEHATDPMHMGSDWVKTQISNTEASLVNRGFCRSIWDYFLTTPKEWRKDDIDPMGVHKGVLAVLTSRGSVSPWWIPAAKYGEKVKLSTSFKKVLQVLEEVNRFKDESMPDDS